MTPDEHKTAAEQALIDAYGTDNPTPALLRGVVHAVLALAPPGPPPAPEPPPTTGRWTRPDNLKLEED